jgi:hypothetical protein
LAITQCPSRVTYRHSTQYVAGRVRRLMNGPPVGFFHGCTLVRFEPSDFGLVVRSTHGERVVIRLGPDRDNPAADAQAAAVPPSDPS